ncbi:MAG: SH3 domain-containing protein [Desulfohalobiaceae bacterium]
MLLVGLFFLLQACAQKQEQRIPDLARLPQDPGFYLQEAQGGQEPFLDSQEQEKAAQEFLQSWSSPWRGEKEPDLQDFAQYARSLQEKELFGENKRPRQAGWLERLLYRSDFANSPALDQPGIVTENSSLRLLPTHRPAFRDFSLAGQGYPFDVLQISAIWAGTPVRILHESRDRAWYLVQSGFALGWMQVQDLAVLDQDKVQEYTQNRFLAVVKDGVSVLGRRGGHLFTAHIGSLFPLLQEQAHGYLALVPVRDEQGRVVLQEAFLARSQAEVFPLPAEPKSIADLASRIMGQSYGWGGLYENRDCSALMRDLFAPLGIWLPRNSRDQAQVGRGVELEDLGPEEKKKRILKQGRPMQSILYMPGHVMLYLGSHQGQPVVLHNMWGLRTKDILGREGREVVGRTVITSLEPGRELFWLDRERGDLLQRMRSMNILGAR